METSGSQTLLEHIADLKNQQAAARAERKKLAKDLRNAQRRRRRLKAKARQLSNNDLLTVLTMRTVESGAASSTEKPEKPASASSTSSKKTKLA